MMLNPKFKLFCIIIVVFLTVIAVKAEHSTFKDTFEEELLLKPLSNGFVYSQFQFTTGWDVDRKTQLHYRLFPKVLGEILEKYNVQELHLSLTQGQWKHKLWGYPVVDAPAGVQLWVWFDQSTNDVDKNWFGLSNALSGLFCASLNFIDKSKSVSPHLSFRPSGVTAENYARNSSLLRYASLPREIVCTENLTPWKKLLPCGTAAGLAALLNARQLFDVHYHSQAIHFRHVCQKNNCEQLSWELGQSLSIVSEPHPSQRTKPDWSLRKIFASSIYKSCPLATTSAVYVDLSSNTSGSYFDLSPQPSQWLKNGRNVPLALYDVTKLTSVDSSHPLNVQATYHSNLQYTLAPTPVLYANRFIKGTGRGPGVIQCLIHYSKMNTPLTVIYMEEIPHFARVFAHTLKIVSNNRSLKPDYLYISERDGGEESFLMEAVITLPPNSVTSITMEFERLFLKFSAYPPDANHGFYIGSAVISTNLETSRNYTSSSNQQSGIHTDRHTILKRYFLRLHTEILLLVLPTPDFSMPYNVICLVCTVVALAFGPLHNITTKKLVAVNQKAGEHWLVKLKKRLLWKKAKPADVAAASQTR